MKYILLLLFVVTIIGCKEKSKAENEQLKKEIKVITAIEKLASDFKFTEGPAVDNLGNVYFSDIPNSKIWIWTITDSLELFRENSNGSNGLFFDKNQNLLACEGQKARITSTNTNGDYRSIATQFDDKPFNQTNDLWPDDKGGVYFTDPQYGGDMDNLNQGGMHVFYLHPNHQKISKVCDDLTRPNGIIGTPDGKTLYVSDRGAGKTYKYDIQDDGTLINKSLFVDLGSDGMTIDQDGNIYLTTKDKSQVDVFSKTGNLLKTIELPETPTNVCFGGKDRNQLYITAQTSLYLVELNTKGVD